MGTTFSVLAAIAVVKFGQHHSWSTIRTCLTALAAAYLPRIFNGSEFRAKGAMWPAFQRCSIWSLLARSLFGSVQVVVEAPEKLRGCKQGVLAVAPHGVVSFNHALFFTDVCKFLSETWPVDRRDLGASAIFKIPVYQELLLWLGCVDAGGQTARAVLRSGRSIFVYPGGEAEQMRTRKGRHSAHWGGRKGFVKLAVEYGIPVIPSYVFGETDCYDTLSFMLSLRMWICNNLKVALPLALGRWGTPIPHKVPLIAVVGKPIEVPKVAPKDPNFAAEVDKAHAKVLEALIDLFDKHKAKYATADATLEVTGSDRKK